VRTGDSAALGCVAGLRSGVRPKMPEKLQQRSGGARLAGIGFELVAAVAGFTLVGFWVDHHYHSAPWGLLVGFALGLVGGMYNLIRETLRAYGRGAATGDKPNDDRER
jgi:F0F1-type ATP synthase assembly protein I